MVTFDTGSMGPPSGRACKPQAGKSVGERLENYPVSLDCVELYSSSAWLSMGYVTQFVLVYVTQSDKSYPILH